MIIVVDDFVHANGTGEMIRAMQITLLAMSVLVQSVAVRWRITLRHPM